MPTRERTSVTPTLDGPVGICYYSGVSNEPMNASYDLSYSLRTEDHDTVRNVRIDFENPSEEFLAEQLNIWLTAIGSELRVDTTTK